MTWNSMNSLQWKNIRLIPIVHGWMEFAQEVRRAFKTFRPDHLAVEYPATLKDRIIQGVKRLPFLSVVHYEEEDGSFVYLLLEPSDGQVEALRLAIQEGLPVHFIDRDTEGYSIDLSSMPDPYAIKKLGYSRYCRTFLKSRSPEARSPEDVLREKTMAYHLQRVSREAERVLFVGGLYHVPGLLKELNQPQTEVIGRRRRTSVGLAHLHQDSSREIMSETPYLAGRYEESRSSGGPADELDRVEIQNDLVDSAREAYWKSNKEELSRNQTKIMYKFAWNYALVTGRLVPNFYQLVVAGRGAGDDDFAYELWEKGSHYPWQTEDPGLPVLRLRGEDLFLDQRRIRFHRRLKTKRRRLVPVPAKNKARERYPGEWRETFGAFSICSYPPEDVVVEDYGRYLKKKALEIGSEEDTRIEPFVSSMMDGVDIRQTLREWPNGRIYVREKRPLRGKVGSVVVIFDPDIPGKDGKESFPWCVTWLGEHEQESDMAFYSTPAGEIMDGPGISRCHYGGFMLTYPPMRVYDIWRDSYFDFARTKPERLLLAALDYSRERHVVYVSPEPPTGWCQSIASRLGKKILYLPIGIFSPVTLKKIRQFHVLDGHHVRKYCHNYI